MPKPWHEVAASPQFLALDQQSQVAAQRQYFDQIVLPRVPQGRAGVAWQQFTTQYPIGTPGQAGPNDRQALETMAPQGRAQVLERARNGGAQTLPQALQQIAGQQYGAAPPEAITGVGLTSSPTTGAAPFSIPPGMGTPERAGLVPPVALGPEGDVLDQVLAAYGVPALAGAAPEAKLAVLKLAVEGRGTQERLSQGEPPPLAKRLAADFLAGTIGVKHQPDIARFIERTPSAEGIPASAASGVGAIADPISLAAFAAGGGVAAGGAKMLGAKPAIQALARGMGAFMAFDTTAEGARQVEEEDFSAGGLAKAAGKGAVMGAAIHPATLIAKPAVRYLVESAIFGTASPLMEGHLPTPNDYAESMALLGVLHGSRLLPRPARDAIAKKPEERTPADKAAIEAVTPEQWKAVGEEIKLLPAVAESQVGKDASPILMGGEGGTNAPTTTPFPQRELERGRGEMPGTGKPQPFKRKQAAQVPDEVLLAEMEKPGQPPWMQEILANELERRTAPAASAPEATPTVASPPVARPAAPEPAGAPVPAQAVPSYPDRLREQASGLFRRAEALEEHSRRRFDSAPGAAITGGSGRRRSGLHRKTDRAIEGSLNDLQEAKRLRERAVTLKARADNNDPAVLAERVKERESRDAVREAVAAKESAERKAAPILNEDTPGALRLTKAEWAKEHSDYKNITIRDGARVRTLLRGGSLQDVFLTDAPIKTRPAQGPAATPAAEAPALPVAASESPGTGKVPAHTAEAPQGAAGAPIDLAARRAARPTGEEGHLNLGTSKPAKPSLKATAAAAGEFQPESKWGGDWWTEGLQNSLIRLYRLEKWGRIKGATAWLGRKAEAYIGRAGHRIEKAQAELEGILKPAFDAGFKPSELGRYMQALHIEERQATMIERGFKGDAAAGMTVAEAKKVIASMPPEIAEHAAKLRAYIDGTLDILVEGQLIPAEVAAEWRQRWPNYVPLLRDFGAGEAVSPDGGGRGFGASAGVKRAKGSKREALPVLAQVATARARAIDLAERGRVGRELLKTIEETGLEKQGWRVEDAESFFVDKDGELMLRKATKDMKNKDNVISVPVEGRTVKIVIPPDQQGIIRAMNGLGVERSIPVLREVNQYLRYMATTGNLEFLVTNFSRDLQEAQIHLAEKGPKVQAEVLRNLPAALKGIADHLAGRDTEWARAREEMAAAGGLTHWSKPARDINKMAAEIEKMAERIETAKTPETRIANGARLIGRGIEGMNEVVEGGVRLSAYRALRRAGVGAEEAALFAKNMTLNFDKKGRWGGLIGSAYLFFNVGVQGPVRMAQFAKKNPGKFASIASGIAVAGYLEAMHNHSANPEEYEKRSTWERDNFWSFMRPGPNGAAAVMRVPYGYNFFKAIGATGYDVQAGLMSERDATNRAFKALVDGFSPVDDILPSALAPFIQIRMNKNWFGGPIRPEQPAYSAKVPDSQLYFKSARPQSVSLAKRLNEMTGGNEVLSGWFDVSPENMDYLVDFAGGGVGKLAGRTTSTLTSLARGDEIDPNQVPFARQFYRVSAKGRERSEVYHMLDESGRRIFTDAEVERFNRYMARAVELGDMDEKKSKRYLRQFEKNQEKAVASKSPKE